MNHTQCIFEYCNCGTGYLNIVLLENNTKAREVCINLDEYCIKDGVITRIDALINRIKSEMKNLNILAFPKIKLLLRCEETYRTSLTLPIKNYFQALRLYNKDLKRKLNKTLYQTVNNSYKYDAGYIFNTYHMSKSIIESFEQIAKQLNTTIDSVEPFGMYLSNCLPYQDTYVYFYIQQKVCTMILVSDKNLITSYDFEFEDDETIKNNFLMVASKYEFEFQHLAITHYGVCADNSIDLYLGLENL